MSQRRSLSIAIAMLALAVSGTGCMTVGHPFATHEVSRLEIGKTSREEVRDLLGEPWRTGLEDGDSTWTYGHYRYSLFGEATTRDLVVRFDALGVVSSYSFNTTVPDDL